MSRQSTGRLILICAMLFILPWSPSTAQDNFRDVIEMSAEVGFDSFFSPGHLDAGNCQAKEQR